MPDAPDTWGPIDVVCKPSVISVPKSALPYALVESSPLNIRNALRPAQPSPDLNVSGRLLVHFDAGYSSHISDTAVMERT